MFYNALQKDAGATIIQDHRIPIVQGTQKQLFQACHYQFDHTFDDDDTAPADVPPTVLPVSTPSVKYTPCICDSVHEVLSKLQIYGMAILRQRYTFLDLQNAFSRAYSSKDTFGTADKRPRWKPIFNAIDKNCAPMTGDGQRLQMVQDDSVMFTKSKPIQRALSELLLKLHGLNPKIHPTKVTKSSKGLKIEVSDTTYDVAANVLRGKSQDLPMSAQPWHCDHAPSGTYSSKKNFPFVVVFPRSVGKPYRCNVVLWNLHFKGEIQYGPDDVVFLRGDTIHGGSANYFDDRFHIYVENNRHEKRKPNATFPVEANTITALMRSGKKPKQTPIDTLANVATAVHGASLGMSHLL